MTPTLVPATMRSEPPERVSDAMAQLQRQLVQSGHAGAARRLETLVMLVRRMEVAMDEIAADAHEQDAIAQHAAAARNAARAAIEAEAAKPGSNVVLWRK